MYNAPNKLYKAYKFVDKNNPELHYIGVKLKSHAINIIYAGGLICKERKKNPIKLKFSIMKTALAICFCGHIDFGPHNIMIRNEQIFPIDFSKASLNYEPTQYLIKELIN